VWLVAAEQAAAVAAGDSVAANSSGGQVGSQQLVASLAMGSGTSDATDPSAADGGLDLAALLLDGRNAPLRRIAMDANPAKTIAGMPREMKAQLKDVSEPCMPMQRGKAGLAFYWHG
jgi:hypothetical protein